MDPKLQADPKAVVTPVHHDWPLPNKIIFWCVHTFGAWAILACVAVGALVIVSIVFKQQIKETVGSLIDWLDKFVNRK